MIPNAESLIGIVANVSFLLLLSLFVVLNDPDLILSFCIPKNEQG